MGRRQPRATLGWELRYCHTDNLRKEQYPHCMADYPCVRTIPTKPVHLGSGEDQPFPAIYSTNDDYSTGLVIGAASQESTFQSWEFVKTPFAGKSVFSTFNTHHELPQSGSFVLGPRTELALDGTFYQILQNTHPRDAYVGYVGYVADRSPFRGSKTHLLDEAFYCSWNYGAFADQYEQKLLKTARFIAESSRGIKWFLMNVVCDG